MQKEIHVFPYEVTVCESRNWSIHFDGVLLLQCSYNSWRLPSSRRLFPLAFINSAPTSPKAQCPLNEIRLFMLLFGINHYLLWWSYQPITPRNVKIQFMKVNLLKPTGDVTHQQFNLIKPTGYVMHQQFNIQQLYALPTLYLCVLYLSEDKERLVPLTA